VIPVWLISWIALGVTVAGLVAAAVTLVATRRPLFAVQVLLDFLLAAGLLRLTGHPDWTVLGGTAAIVALRQVVGFGLRAGAPAWAPDPAPR
jgi:hypothetical protein